MYDLINYYSVTDIIIQLIVDFRHIFLVLVCDDDDDDDDVFHWFFILFRYVVRLCVYMLCEISTVCIHIITMVTSLMSSTAFLVVCHICTYNFQIATPFHSRHHC